eukprot:1291605-Rhodomonas_salina.1
MVSFDPLTSHDSCPSPIGVCCSGSGITTTSSKGVALSDHHFTISQVQVLLVSSRTLYSPHENTGCPVRKCWLSLGQQLHARTHQTAVMHSENALLLSNKRRLR